MGKILQQPKVNTPIPKSRPPIHRQRQSVRRIELLDIFQRGGIADEFMGMIYSKVRGSKREMASQICEISKFSRLLERRCLTKISTEAVYESHEFKLAVHDLGECN